MIKETSFNHFPVLGCADSPGVWLTALRFSCRRFSTRKRLCSFAHRHILLSRCKETSIASAPNRFCYPD
jgi:hypothetical protein